MALRNVYRPVTDVQSVSRLFSLLSAIVIKTIIKLMLTAFRRSLKRNAKINLRQSIYAGVDDITSK